jgi:pyridoxal phosphate enzyme (YggS family)
MNGLRSRLEQVQARIAAAARRAGRDPASVRLIAVSKLQPAEAIRAAYELGQRDFGENYAQELRDKMELLADLPDIRWHAIGPLQSNKARYVAGRALVHTLDRPELARALLARHRPMRCLVAVNVAEEAQKSGVTPEALPSLLEELRLPDLELAGLMCIPPHGEEPEDARSWFRMLRELRDRHLPGGELSMGMSEDLEVAIEEGATLVRVGTAIFGERPRSS